MVCYVLTGKTGRGKQQGGRRRHAGGRRCRFFALRRSFLAPPAAQCLPHHRRPGRPRTLPGRAALLACVRELPTGQRAVLVLRYFDDLTEAETARVLGCSIGTVKSQHARALARLRELAPGGSAGVGLRKRRRPRTGQHEQRARDQLRTAFEQASDFIQPGPELASRVRATARRRRAMVTTVAVACALILIATGVSYLATGLRRDASVTRHHRGPTGRIARTLVRADFPIEQLAVSGRYLYVDSRLERHAQRL